MTDRQFILTYPPGYMIYTDIDPSGKIVDNSKIAKYLLDAFHSGKSIALPFGTGWKLSERLPDGSYLVIGGSDSQQEN